MKQTPQIVKDAASYLIEMFGDNFDYLGKHEGADVYVYHFSEEVTAGFPPVYLYKDGAVEELTGDVASYFLDSFVEDFDKIEVK